MRSTRPREHTARAARRTRSKSRGHAGRVGPVVAAVLVATVWLGGSSVSSPARADEPNLAEPREPASADGVDDLVTWSEPLGSHCSDPAYTVDCPGGQTCCKPGQTCTPGGCCPEGYPYDCGNGTCATNSSNCDNGDGGSCAGAGDDGQFRSVKLATAFEPDASHCGGDGIVDCGGNTHCCAGYICVSDGCCREEFPYYCGDGTCATTPSGCDCGGGGGGGGGDGGDGGDDDSYDPSLCSVDARRTGGAWGLLVVAIAAGRRRHRRRRR